MALSTIYTWLVLGAGLGILYFLACGVTEERVRKWARKGLEQADEMEVMRLQTCAFPLFPALSLFVAVLLILGSAQALYEELPGKITGSWPICEGTIQGWHRGYRSSKGYAMIEVEGETKGYDILNGRIQKGELVGVTVRMACNGNRACILEYHTPEGWVREMYLPNYGREPYVVAQTLAMNLLAGALSCGLILKKLLRPEPGAFLRNRRLRNLLGVGLMACTLAAEIFLWRTVPAFQATWLGEEKMVRSQIAVVVLVCANVGFCALASRKSSGYAYWWTTAKAFCKALEEQEKKK